MKAKFDLSATRFRNVDLDIYSRYDLGPLVRRLGTKVDVLFVGRERGKYSTHLELRKHLKTADSAIGAFCSLIATLPKLERRLWDTAITRSFSVGVQAGLRPRPCDFTIRSKTLAVVSELGAEIVLTVYPFEPSGNNI